ncbi:MAG: host specificity factor TipJ family phage tail protein, partial [Phaeobacter italicus]
MTATPAHVPVLAAPHWTPDAACIELDVPHGLTVAEIVRMALPGATDAELMRARVALVTPRGMSIIAPKHWRYLRPNPDVQVVIRIIPGKNSVRKILMIVVAVGAVALGQTWALSLGLGSAAATSLAASVFAGGLTFLGNLVINALIPPETPAGRETRTTYSISGVKNRLTPNGAVPVILGKMRVAPPFAMTPYTEIVGDQQYLRCLFVIGEGQVGIDDMRLGETSLAEYDEVETEVRYGVAGEAAGSLCPRQVFEEQIGVELTRPLPRDDAGGVIKGDPAIETPVVRTTGADASGACIILSWPAGLIRFNDNGDPRSRTVCVRIEQRRVDATEWQQVADLDIAAKRAEGFFRQHSWEFPSRGRWQVRLTMLTDENTSTRIQQRTTWAALQTLRPEYPLAYPRPLALVALRIKATHQLSGALDDFNCLVTRICPDWDSATGSWIPRATENPASLYRHILQDPALPEPRTNAQIDLDQLEAWHAFCTAQGLTYNAALSDTGTTLHDILTEVAAAGRATPRHDGRTYGVVIDQPTDDTLIVDHISPRNSWGFKARRSYFKPPHASVVTFLDADNDYKQTQRTIRWPGFDGDIEVTEELPMSGKVYASEVWREARRRQLEALYRPDTFEATQDGLFRVATRGDAVITNHTTLQRDHMTGRVRRVFGDLIEIDDIVLMEADLEYAVRFRWFED